MPPKKKRLDSQEQTKVVAGARSAQEEREKTFREQALKLFPHVCGRCCREFSGPQLRELTVHHKDSDHMNNPPDGSNWELLCIYCHDDEHQNSQYSGYQQSTTRYSDEDSSPNDSPFAGLADLLKPKDDASSSE